MADALGAMARPLYRVRRVDLRAQSHELAHRGGMTVTGRPVKSSSVCLLTQV